MKRARSTGEFQLEREMSAYAMDWLEQSGLHAKKEFYTPWGICDLVGVEFSRRRVQQRLRLGQRNPIGPPLRIELLNHIPEVQTGKSITVGRLEREFQNIVTGFEVRRELERLEQAKFIQSPRSGLFQKLNGWIPLHKTIVAIELKLNRIEEALSQARSHLEFATKVFVGLPCSVAERLIKRNRVAQFTQSGIGILAVGRKSCRIVFPAREKKVPLHSVWQMHCVERFWRSRIRDN